MQALLEESRALARDKPLRSRELLREVLELEPDNPVAVERLAMKSFVDERHAESKALAARCSALTADPRCAQVSTLSVELNDDVEKLAGATRQCLVDTPNSVVCMAGMVNYHLAKGEVQEAALLAGRMTQVAPADVETLAARGRIKAADRRYAEAL